MKVILLDDTHLGARNASSHFSRHFNRFFTSVLYPYVKHHGIEHIIQLGDLFDSRTTLSLKAFHDCKDVWFAPLKELNCTMHVLLGNHDVTYKNTLEVNSPELFLKQYGDSIRVYNKPTRDVVPGVDLVPWICDENYEEVMTFIKEGGKYLCGHFEIAGFQMYRNSTAHDGLSQDLFDKYGMVFSGHYHHKSQKGNILYVGTPYEITWSDYADPRGFHVLDTDKGTIEFVRNPHTQFMKLYWNDGASIKDLKEVNGQSVRVVVEKKSDAFLFDTFIASLKLNQPYDLQIVEDTTMYSEGEVNESVDIEDPAAIIDSYIDSIEMDVDRDRVKQYVRSLYNEAIAA